MLFQLFHFIVFCSSYEYFFVFESIYADNKALLYSSFLVGQKGYYLSIFKGVVTH